MSINQNKKRIMKAKIIKTYDFKIDKEYFGIAFQVKKGSKYCKYPIGLQRLESKETAKTELLKVQDKLDHFTKDQIEFINKQPINKHQFVKL